MITIITGGPSYRLMRHEQSATALMELAVLCERFGSAAAAHGSQSGFSFAGHNPFHTSDLWGGRALWLREHIADKRIDAAIAVDTDTTFNAMRLLLEVRDQVVCKTDVAIGLCPVRRGGTGKPGTKGTGECNLQLDGGKHIREGGLVELLRSERRDIVAGGFGVAVFNLGWYREHWPLPEPEEIRLGLGEDIEHCHAVRKRGGRVVALAVPTEHFAFGEQMTR